MTALHYAKASLLNRSSGSRFGPQSMMYIFRAKTLHLAVFEYPRGENHEFHVLSHVPASSVEGIFIGFPRRSPHVDDLYSTAPAEWYYLEINHRDEAGIPSKISLYNASPKLKEEFEIGIQKGQLLAIWDQRRLQRSGSISLPSKADQIIQFILAQ